MLIDSPRLTAADREAWAHRAASFALHARVKRARLDRLTDEAIEEIRRFTDEGEGGHVSVSWGKDSVVVAHLAVLADCPLPLVWVRVRRWGNPDCEAVMAAFTERFDVDVDVVDVDASAPRRWEADYQGAARTSRGGFAEADRRHGARRITGIRAQESDDRALSAVVHGVSTARSCRPILRWSMTDVFAYLARHDLPIHPAYAMSMGGTWPIERLRVSSIGGSRGGPHRAAWEARYYPDFLNPKDTP